MQSVGAPPRLKSRTSCFLIASRQQLTKPTTTSRSPAQDTSLPFRFHAHSFPSVISFSRLFRFSSIYTFSNFNTCLAVLCGQSQATCSPLPSQHRILNRPHRSATLTVSVVCQEKLTR